MPLSKQHVWKTFFSCECAHFPTFLVVDLIQVLIKKDYISAFVHLSPIVLDVLTLATGESESLPVLLGGVVHGQLGLLTEVASEANHVEVFLEKHH